MENIGAFLTALPAFGVRPEDTFQTADLYEGVNMAAVGPGEGDQRRHLTVPILLPAGPGLHRECAPHRRTQSQGEAASIACSSPHPRHSQGVKVEAQAPTRAQVETGAKKPAGVAPPPVGKGNDGS
jgi:hypothetical protein